jgi:hypothetical protein
MIDSRIIFFWPPSLSAHGKTKGVLRKLMPRGHGLSWITGYDLNAIA